MEFKVRDESGLLGIGEMITPGWFREGQFVDARANCRGMGFAGGMKRWGFHGQPASHGVSLAHRSMGSAGQSQGGGSRVYPGKKMAGRMGGQRVTVQNVKVLKIDEPNGLVILNGQYRETSPGRLGVELTIMAGCIAGPQGCLVQLQDALKKPWPEILDTSTTADTGAKGLKATA